MVLSGSAAEQRLRMLGDVTIHTERGADRETELVRRISDADAVLSLRAHARYSARVLDACPHLRMISIWGTGTDNVDLPACAARGVVVRNTPGLNAHAVAEHTLALILAIARRVPQLDAELRAGQWPRMLLVQLEGKTLGLVGLGAIGRRVAELARPFGMRLLATTWGADAGRSAAAGAQHVPLESLLAESDVVSVHLRLGAELPP